MLKASKHETHFKIRNHLRPVRDDHVIGTRWKHSNVLSRGVLISRFLLGNLTITKTSPTRASGRGSEADDKSALR